MGKMLIWAPDLVYHLMVKVRHGQLLKTAYNLVLVSRRKVLFQDQDYLQRTSEKRTVVKQGHKTQLTISSKGVSDTSVTM